jgi:hypothetical protein
MDRSALFIDVGYLLSGAGALCLGAEHRGEVSADWTQLLPKLMEKAAEVADGLPLLRTYWYDGARRQKLTAEHELVANVPNVKLRIGRIENGRQKGVDSRLVRDLMTLAFRSAIATAVLVGGDDDLREGVEEAQDLGLRVVLIGIPDNKRAMQARALVRAADDNVVLPQEFWSPFFRRVVDAGQVLAQPEREDVEPVEKHASEEEIATGVTPAAAEDAADELETARDGWLASSTQRDTVYSAGFDFGQRYAADRDLGALLKLAQRDPFVPFTVDAALLKFAERALGRSLVDHEGLRRTARDGFWFAVHSAIERHSGDPDGRN